MEGRKKHIIVAGRITSQPCVVQGCQYQPCHHHISCWAEKYCEQKKKKKRKEKIWGDSGHMSWVPISIAVLVGVIVVVGRERGGGEEQVVSKNNVEPLNGDVATIWRNN
jgi:hypothetical protein